MKFVRFNVPNFAKEILDTFANCTAFFEQIREASAVTVMHVRVANYVPMPDVSKMNGKTVMSAEQWSAGAACH